MTTPARSPIEITGIIPMFRSAGVTASVIEALARCHVPEGCSFTVIVVDDASGDGSAEAIESMAPPFAKVVRNPENVGRSRTRNIGGNLARAGYLLFLDGDCIPANPDFLRVHVDAMDAGNDISIGAITGTGEGFWHLYQQRVAERRSQVAAMHGAARAATSPNFMIRRDAFARLSGFDEAYEGYGFEDRDFFLRAQKFGMSIAWSASALAIHADQIELVSVCRKMREAGGKPAARFAAAHPDVYASLGYAALDARRHPWLRHLRPFTSLVARGMIFLFGKRLDSRLVPFAWRTAIVRLAVAASYLDGSCENNAVVH